jgi:hypothetical protein
MKKPTKNELTVTLVVTVLVFLFNIIPNLIGDLHLWPMFFGSVFFFLLAHGDIKKIPYILTSGVVGILLTGLMYLGIGALTPVVGSPYATWICLGIVLVVVIIGGTALPFALNSIAFGFIVMTSAELSAGMKIAALSNAASYNIMAHCLEWILYLVIGGGIMCLICGGVMTGMKNALTKKALKKAAENVPPQDAVK